MRPISLTFGAILLAIAAVFPAIAQTDLVALAKSQRYAGQLDQAEATLRRMLATNPNHYLAIYSMGLVYEARAQRLPASARSPQLLRSASWLESARALRNNPTLNIQEYTIYNTLGYVYLQLRDITKAEIVLNEGKAHEAKLTPASRAKFNNNLGYLASLKGDRTAASVYFNKSAQSGNPIAQQNSIRLKSAAPPPK
jgi:Flp pilus assembly protein TadD